MFWGSGLRGRETLQEAYQQDFLQDDPREGGDDFKRYYHRSYNMVANQFIHFVGLS